jgi:hypothetical protein
MSKDYLETFPLRPSHSTSVAYGLCMVMADLAEFEAGGETSRRAYLKMCALAVAAELFSKEAAHFFGSRKGEDEDRLEALEDNYMKEHAPKAK